MLFFRSLSFYLGLVAATLFFTLLAIFALVLPFRRRYLLVIYWVSLSLWWLRFTCNIHYQVIGRENIPKEPGIVMCKHQSLWETLALQLFFTPQAWILKREILWNPFYGLGAAVMQPIAINRRSGTQAIRQIIREGRKRLSQGIWVVIFPEGTRVAPGKKGRYFAGGAMLAQKAGADIIPVAHNAGYLWPSGQFIKRPGTITLAIGPSIQVNDRSPTELMARVEHWIETTVASLADPRQCTPADQ